MIFDFLQLIGGLILSFGFMPQLYQIFKTKSVQDLNLTTNVTTFIGIACMEVYAINLVVNGVGLMFLITNTCSLVISFAMVYLILIYKEKKGRINLE